VTARIAAVPPSFLSRALYPRVTVAEYREMINNGTFTDGDPIELLEGYLVQKMPRNDPHETSLRRLTNRLPRWIPAGYCFQIQAAIELSDSQPEPDGAILRGADSDHDGTIPKPDVICLLFEVSDSSLHTDRSDKGRIYARAGIVVYWIINVADKQIEVYTDPDTTAEPPAYRTRTDYRPGDAVPITLDGAAIGTIPVSELLP
jgi:Uma2 family endonuclease